MTRPALSALRAIEIIDFMSQAPGQAYTLSELVRHTGTNVASLHAILTVLMRRGYLMRHPTHKTYRLSPALAAIGEAVAASEPVLGHARAAAEGLAKRTSLEVTVTARVGEDVICLSRAAGSPLSRASMRIGQRLRLHPPLGALYYGWADAEDIDAWIARGDAAYVERARAALDIVRNRGFLVTVRSSAKSALVRASAAGEEAHGRKGQDLSRAFRELQHTVYQPEQINTAEHYEVDIISSPIFDQAGQASYAINLNGFAGSLSGDEIYKFAQLLTEASGDVMRDSGIHLARLRA